MSSDRLGYMALLDAAAASLGLSSFDHGERYIDPRRHLRRSDVQRCYFTDAKPLPLEPPKPLTKRQRRRLRGKSA